MNRPLLTRDTVAEAVVSALTRLKHASAEQITDEINLSQCSYTSQQQVTSALYRLGECETVEANRRGIYSLKETR
jgi:hypothetical protein